MLKVKSLVQYMPSCLIFLHKCINILSPPLMLWIKLILNGSFEE